MHNYIGLLDGLEGLECQQIRIARSCADQRHLANVRVFHARDPKRSEKNGVGRCAAHALCDVSRRRRGCCRR